MTFEEHWATVAPSMSIAVQYFSKPLLRDAFNAGVIHAKRQRKEKSVDVIGAVVAQYDHDKRQPD